MGKKKSILIAALGICGLVLLAIFYYFYNPEHYAWMPQCWFHKWTGWQCPACGNQRALHCFLHGEWLKALQYNFFSILSIPYFLAVCWTTFDRRPLAQKWRGIVQHQKVIMTYFFMVIGWWIGRNILGI